MLAGRRQLRPRSDEDAFIRTEATSEVEIESALMLCSASAKVARRLRLLRVHGDGLEGERCAKS